MKQKTCVICKSKFTPFRTTARVCSPKCAIEWNRLQDEKRFKQETTRLKMKLQDNDRKHWLKAAQNAFNAFIRARDRQDPCISCGRRHEGQWHAGHYRTTKAAPQLRFNELNCHKQCQPCNSHLSGNITEYRINLVKKIGIKAVEWIESNHVSHPYTINELKEITVYFKEKLKLEKEKSHFDKWVEHLDG